MSSIEAASMPATGLFVHIGLTSLILCRWVVTRYENTLITIFSDTQEALMEFQKVSPLINSPYLKGLIHQRTNNLKHHGHPVTFCWIPSQIGHDQADQKAKDKACRGRKPEEQWSSLTYVKRKLVESQAQELTRWHETKSQERETSRRGFYIPRLEKGMSKLLRSASKKYASRYLQLKVGHGVVGTYLARIGAVETSQCWWCSRAEKNVEHLYDAPHSWRILIHGYLPHPWMSALLRRCVSSVSSRAGPPTWKKSMDNWSIPWIATQIWWIKIFCLIQN